MHRELVLLTDRELTAHDLATAAASVDPRIGMTSVEGASWHVLADPASDLPMLNAMPSTLVPDGTLAQRLLPGSEQVQGPVWWTDLYAPRSGAIELGVRVARALAQQTGGELRIVEFA